MPNIARQTIPVDVGCPLEFGRVGVAGADVAGLKLLELLLGAEFVRLCREKVSYEMGRTGLWTGEGGKALTIMYRGNGDYEKCVVRRTGEVEARDAYVITNFFQHPGYNEKSKFEHLHLISYLPIANRQRLP